MIIIHSVILFSLSKWRFQELSCLSLSEKNTESWPSAWIWANKSFSKLEVGSGAYQGDVCHCLNWPFCEAWKPIQMWLQRLLFGNIQFYWQKGIGSTHFHNNLLEETLNRSIIYSCFAIQPMKILQYYWLRVGDKKGEDYFFFFFF